MERAGSGVPCSSDEGVKVGLVDRVGEGPLPKGDVHLFHGEPLWFPGGLSQVCEGRGSVYGCSRDMTQDPLDDGARLGQGANEGSRGMEGSLADRVPALTSDGLAPVSGEVYNEMLAKHPQSPPPLSPADQAPTPVQITAEGVIKALKSFPSGSAPGPSSPI